MNYWLHLASYWLYDVSEVEMSRRQNSKGKTLRCRYLYISFLKAPITSILVKILGLGKLISIASIVASDSTTGNVHNVALLSLKYRLNVFRPPSSSSDDRGKKAAKDFSVL